MPITLKLSLIFFLIMLANCSNYYRFDQLYNKQDYENAYVVLKQKENINQDSYRERELKVVLHLATEGKIEYLPILDNILLKPIPNNMTNWYDLSKTWIRFISAQTPTDYKNILTIIPKESFKENSIEQLRLIIQSHSLLRLKRYQEILAYLKISPHAKNSSDLIYIKGMALYNLSNNTDALLKFQALVRTSANPILKSLGYFYIADILEKEGSIKKAESAYFNAWNLNPTHAELNFRIGRILQKKAYTDLHARFYRASLRLNENMAEAWYYLNMQ